MTDLLLRAEDEVATDTVNRPVVTTLGEYSLALKAGQLPYVELLTEINSDKMRDFKDESQSAYGMIVPFIGPLISDNAEITQRLQFAPYYED